MEKRICNFSSIQNKEQNKLNNTQSRVCLYVCTYVFALYLLMYVFFFSIKPLIVVIKSMTNMQRWMHEYINYIKYSRKKKKKKISMQRCSSTTTIDNVVDVKLYNICSCVWMQQIVYKFHFAIIPAKSVTYFIIFYCLVGKVKGSGKRAFKGTKLFNNNNNNNHTCTAVLVHRNLLYPFKTWLHVFLYNKNINISINSLNIFIKYTKMQMKA